MSPIDAVRALTFDVFGTVVDWRGSLVREGEAFGRAHGLAVDWGRFADDWRGLYQPSMERVRTGAAPWTNLDALHRMSLDRVLAQHGIKGLEEADIDHLNRAWHRLDPWPDAVAGMTRLRLRYPLATLSNGNVALLVAMARRAGLPWDAILGAEVAQAYKPLPKAYLTTAALLGLAPEQCMLVAAHVSDLVAARGCGFRTAFVRRPREYGPRPADVLPQDHGFDVVAEDFLDLADKLGAA